MLACGEHRRWVDVKPRHTYLWRTGRHDAAFHEKLHSYYVIKEQSCGVDSSLITHPISPQHEWISPRLLLSHLHRRSSHLRQRHP